MADRVIRVVEGRVIVVSDLDRLRALIDAVREMLERETDAALAAFVEDGRAALERFGDASRDALDDFGVTAAGAVQDFTARTEGRLVQVEATLLEVLDQGGVAAAGPLIDLTNPGLSGLLPLRLDGLDPDGSNTARINATLALCAGAGLPVGIPANVLIGSLGTIIFPDFLDLRGAPGHEVRSLGSGQLFATDGQAHGVRISGLRWRGMPSARGHYFTGDFTDSVLSDLDHLGSAVSGLAFAWGRLERTKVYRIRARGMPDTFGAGGSRWLGGGIDSTIYDADIESYDDAIQMIPAEAAIGITFENCGYVRPRGISRGARGLIIGTNPNTNTWMRNVFSLDGFYSGGGWGVRVGAKGHFQYPVVGKIEGGQALIALSSVNRRFNPPIKPTEVVRITSPSTPGFMIVGPLTWRGTTSYKGRLIFSVAAKTISAPDSATAFAAIAAGTYIKVVDSAEVRGPNHTFFARVAGKVSDNVLALDLAPIADEDSLTYTLGDAVNVAVPTALPNGAIPADAVIRRNITPTIDGLRITGVIDDAPGIRATAASMAGYILGFDIDLTIRNPRVQLLGINDGAPEPSGGTVRVRSDQPPSAPDGSPLVDVQFTIGTTIILDATTAPGQDGAFIRSRTVYDDDFEDVLYNTGLAQSTTVSGVVRGISAQMAAVRTAGMAQRVKVKDLIPVAAPGVTNARLAFFAVDTSGFISGCDLAGIATGNSYENAIALGLRASVQIAADNLALPGYSLLPGATKTGTVPLGATQIDMEGSVPASLVTRLDLDLDGVPQRAGVDFTTNGTNFLTLSAPVDGASSYSLRHRV